MADTAPPASRAGELPATLPSELLPLVARRALAADGDSVQTWLRLSLVSHTFHRAIAGECELCVRAVHCVPDALPYCVPGGSQQQTPYGLKSRVCTTSFTACLQSHAVHVVAIATFTVGACCCTAEYCRSDQLADLSIVIKCCATPGVHPVASYDRVMTAAQQEWLSNTTLPLSKVVLHRKDEATSAMLQTVRRRPVSLIAHRSTQVTALAT